MVSDGEMREDEETNEAGSQGQTNVHKHVNSAHMVMIFVPVLSSYQIATPADVE